VQNTQGMLNSNSLPRHLAFDWQWCRHT